MADQSHNTALLLFSRSSGEESRAKNFLPYQHYSQNKKIAQSIIKHAMFISSHSGLPYFVWDEDLQQGKNFGERISNAVEDIFNKGFDKIIVIGNDCITLNKEQINNAATALQSYESVLAPTNKGGAYLIGISKTFFNKESFTNIRWQTTSVAEDLQKLHSASSVFCLPMMDDINDFNDLTKQLLELSSLHPLRIFLKSIIASILQYFIPSENFIPLSIFRYLFRITAPPVLSSLY